MHSFKAKYQNGKLEFINEVPNINKSEVIVTFLNDNEECSENDRIEALEQLVSCFKELSVKKIDEFDEATIRKPLLENRMVNL